MIILNKNHSNKLQLRVGARLSAHMLTITSDGVYGCDASNSSSNSFACARLARLCQVASQVG